MPCYTEPHSYCDHDKNECTEINSDKYIKSVIDNLTKMLCHVMSEIQYQIPGITLNEDVILWWRAHKIFDEKRKLKIDKKEAQE